FTEVRTRAKKSPRCGADDDEHARRTEDREASLLPIRGLRLTRWPRNYEEASDDAYCVRSSPAAPVAGLRRCHRGSRRPPRDAANGRVHLAPGDVAQGSRA